MLGLRCCTGFSLDGASGDYSPVAVQELLIAVASLLLSVVGSRHVGSTVAAPGSSSTDSELYVHHCVHGLSCSMACGIFLDQGSNPCLLHWLADSLTLSPQGSPVFSFLRTLVIELGPHLNPVWPHLNQ